MIFFDYSTLGFGAGGGEAHFLYIYIYISKESWPQEASILKHPF